MLYPGHFKTIRQSYTLTSKDTRQHREALSVGGYTILDEIIQKEDIAAILAIIEQADTSKATFRKTNDVFAIRQFLKEVPDVQPYIFTPALMELITSILGDGFFAVKSIYFDKPGASNWFVAYHQDLTISVDKKATIAGYGPWSVKQDQFAVQPPLSILEDNFTLRLHLDDTNEENGALRVIPGSHLKGIYRPETIDWATEHETYCNVGSGGVMIMRPLLLHASGRTTNNRKRRVVHIEFSRSKLPEPLQWSEQIIL